MRRASLWRASVRRQLARELPGLLAQMNRTTVRGKRTFTADTGSGCNGVDPVDADGQRGACRRDIGPKSTQCQTNFDKGEAPLASPCPAPREPLPQRRGASKPIVLQPAISAMDQRAIDQFAKMLDAKRPAPVDADGKVYCSKCADETLVPTWFGRDCIERGCPLKGLK